MSYRQRKVLLTWSQRICTCNEPHGHSGEALKKSPLSQISPLKVLAGDEGMDYMEFIV